MRGQGGRAEVGERREEEGRRREEERKRGGRERRDRKGRGCLTISPLIKA